jgi:hypothetical protein
MNSKLLALEEATDWVEERKRLSARELRRERERERERERTTNQVSRSQIGNSDVASLASRISCSVCRKPPAQTLVINF